MWFHLDCTKLSRADFEVVSGGDKLGIHWYCKKCDNVCAALGEHLEKIHHTLEVIAAQKVQPASSPDPSYADVLVNKIDDAAKKNQTLQEQVSRQIQNIRAELETENRAKNLVIFSLAENEAGGTLDSVTQVMKDCGFQRPLTVGQVTRLGAKKEGGRSRPIKVSMNTEADKWEFIRRINAVKPNKIFARLDLTKDEQQQDFHLRQELKKARETDPDNNYKIIRNKIVKIQK
jgi:hypothetical protein